LAGFCGGSFKALKLVRLQVPPKAKYEFVGRQTRRAPSRCTDEVVAEIIQCGEPIFFNELAPSFHPDLNNSEQFRSDSIRGGTRRAVEPLRQYLIAGVAG